MPRTAPFRLLGSRWFVVVSLVAALAACAGTGSATATAGAEGAAHVLGGTTGSAGVNGSAGTFAMIGSSGATAISGSAGGIAIAGTSGAAGIAGVAGASGSGGTSATSGAGGNAGASGHAGVNGSGTGGAGGTGGTGPMGMPPGDIAAAAGTPLVAAHSMTRAMYAAYSGKLFQARRASDGKTQDIGVVNAGGSVDSDTLSTFCATTTCSVAVLYDQTGNANDLPQANAANQPVIQYWPTSDGTKLPMAVTVNKQWLRNRTKTHKIPVGAASQTEYWVVHGSHYNAGCCYDYGNMEVNVRDDGPGTMSALYFGSSTSWTKGAGKGPWGMTDYENGLFAGAVKDPGGTNTKYPSLAYPGNNIVVVLTKSNGTTSWVLKAGNAATGPLTAYWDGSLPATTDTYYSPLRQQGGLSLGEGGDGSNSGTGAFSEGVVIASVTSDATDDLIQANIVSVYGR